MSSTVISMSGSEWSLNVCAVAGDFVVLRYSNRHHEDRELESLLSTND